MRSWWRGDAAGKERKRVDQNRRPFNIGDQVRDRAYPGPVGRVTGWSGRQVQVQWENLSLRMCWPDNLERVDTLRIGDRVQEKQPFRQASSGTIMNTAMGGFMVHWDYMWNNREVKYHRADKLERITMPCTTPDPSGAQQDRQEAAQLLIYVMGKYNRIPSQQLEQDARNSFLNDDHWVQVLCAELQDMKLHSHRFEEIVYNAHDPQSRRLANWWERHEAADIERERKEKLRTPVSPAWQQD